MNNAIRDRAWEIYKKHLGIFILVSIVPLIVTVPLSYLESSTGNNIAIVMVSVLVNSLLTACIACFDFRAYNRGEPDIQDCFALFKMKNYFSKLLVIIAVQFLINLASNLVSMLFADKILINTSARLALALLGIFLAAIFELFISNPDYDVATYFKASVHYMGANLWNYLGLMFGFILIIIVAALVCLFIGLMVSFIAVLVLRIGVAVFMPYVSLCVAGFKAEIIPSEWYEGTAQF